MEIGVVPNPRHWERWGEAEAMLEPARERGGFASVLEPDEILWAVIDGDDLLACATAWLSAEGYVEVKLIGGRDHRRWLRQLDRKIGAAAAEAGATRLVGMGRAGWWKTIRAMGWEKHGESDGNTVFSRRLGG